MGVGGGHGGVGMEDTVVRRGDMEGRGMGDMGVRTWSWGHGGHGATVMEDMGGTWGRSEDDVGLGTWGTWGHSNGGRGEHMGHMGMQ